MKLINICALALILGTSFFMGCALFGKATGIELSGPCKKNFSARLKPIEDNYYPKVMKGEPKKLWFARKDFEVARWILTGGKEGFASGGGVCTTKDKVHPEYKNLQEEFKKVEGLVEKFKPKV